MSYLPDYACHPGCNIESYHTLCQAMQLQTELLLSTPEVTSNHSGDYNWQYENLCAMLHLVWYQVLIVTDMWVPHVYWYQFRR